MTWLRDQVASFWYGQRNIRFSIALFRQHAMTKHRKWRAF